MATYLGLMGQRDMDGDDDTTRPEVLRRQRNYSMCASQQYTIRARIGTHLEFAVGFGPVAEHVRHGRPRAMTEHSSGTRWWWYGN